MDISLETDLLFFYYYHHHTWSIVAILFSHVAMLLAKKLILWKEERQLYLKGFNDLDFCLMELVYWKLSYRANSVQSICAIQYDVMYT
jgi:hypothetical protein